MRAGARPDPARATWNRLDGVSPWPGGADGGAALLAFPTATAAVGRTYRWVSWDVTEMVEDWVARPGTNFGMAVEGDASASRDSSRYFASAEHPDPGMRPQLLITYVENR